MADAAVNETYDGLGAVCDLLLTAFDRNSFDGRGAPLKATVHYGTGFDNAFWNGDRMVIGDGDGQIFRGYTGAVSIIGHEIGHGLIQDTAGLEYKGEPGALNESIADTLGALTEQRLRGQTADKADWLIGVGIFTPAVRGKALRSRIAPGTAYNDDVLGPDPQVSHMRDYVQTTEDNGGVHINSGIPNRAFALFASTIGGNAWETAGGIWYRALTSGLSTTTTFAAFAAASIAAAANGKKVVAALRDAWEAVGVLDGKSTSSKPSSEKSSGKKTSNGKGTTAGKADVDGKDDGRSGSRR